MTESQPLESGREYVDLELSSLEWIAEEVADARFEDCRFETAVLQRSVFRRCRFVDCAFENCDLGAVRLPETALRGTTFRRCRLTGVDWSEGAGLDAAEFRECVLDFGSFPGLALPGIVLRDCQAHELLLEGADLTKADCRGTDFDGTRFGDCRLIRADFRGARNYVIDPRSNIVTGARFALPEATGLLHGLDIELD